MILSRFINVINEVQNTGLVLDESDREIFLLLLIDAITDIERSAHLLYIMSKTYYDVSDEFMMNQIANIHSLLLSGTDREREMLSAQLNQNASEATRKIIDLVREREHEYIKRNNIRQQQYRDFLSKSTVDNIEQRLN